MAYSAKVVDGCYGFDARSGYRYTQLISSTSSFVSMLASKYRNV